MSERSCIYIIRRPIFSHVAFALPNWSTAAAVPTEATVSMSLYKYASDNLLGTVY